eukprot:gb/GEZN01008563.1/.p1 GENE.gb/GEZN01008563.1/~~gb/GEZN01008563.1/.p1  ORF type:complete len:403 (-),score=24.42 gb/GEZN01008563.1/:207-1415(-)
MSTPLCPSPLGVLSLCFVWLPLFSVVSLEAPVRPVRSNPRDINTDHPLMLPAKEQSTVSVAVLPDADPHVIRLSLPTSPTESTTITRTSIPSQAAAAATTITTTASNASQPASAANSPPAAWGAKTRSGSTQTVRMKAYVIGSSNTSARMAQFRTNWQRVWPALSHLFIKGEVRSVRGVGVTEALIRAVQDAIDNDIDLLWVNEDDADPFKQTDWPFWFISRLRQSRQSNASFLFLGAHRIRYDEQNFSPDMGVLRVHKLYGAYAWVAWREAFEPLASLWRQHLAIADASHETHVDPDEVWWQLWQTYPAYVTVPLMVDHPPGWSATWNKTKNAGWEGHSDFWNYPDDPYWLMKRLIILLACVCGLFCCLFMTPCGRAGLMMSLPFCFRRRRAEKQLQADAL